MKSLLFVDVCIVNLHLQMNKVDYFYKRKGPEYLFLQER